MSAPSDREEREPEPAIRYIAGRKTIVPVEFLTPLNEQDIALINERIDAIRREGF